MSAMSRRLTWNAPEQARLVASDDPILDCDQVVLTPHAADQTPEGVDLLNEGAVDNVIAFLEGQSRNNVAV